MNSQVVARLGELSPILNVRRGLPTQRTTEDGDVPVMSVADLRNMARPRHFTDVDEMEDAGLDFAIPGDLLVAIEGGTIGEAKTVLDELPQFIPSQQVAAIRVSDPAEIDPWYLGAWFASHQAREQLRRISQGAGIKRIAMKDLASLTVPIPPIEQQRVIGARFRAFETSISRHRELIACLQDLQAADTALTFLQVTGDAE